MTRGALAVGSILAAACGAPLEPDAARPVSVPGIHVAPAMSATSNACAAPPFPVEIIGFAPDATYLAGDPTSLFWSDGDAVFSLPLDGGKATRILDQHGAKPIRKVRVVGDNLFVLQRDKSPCHGRVATAPRTGGPLSTVGQEACITDFDVAGDWLVYTTEIFDERLGERGTLWKVRVAGGPAHDVFNLFRGTTHVVTDGAHAYLSLDHQQLHRVSLATSDAMVLHDGIEDGDRAGVYDRFLAVDDRSVYFGLGQPFDRGLRLFRSAKASGDVRRLGYLFPAVGPSNEERRRFPMGELAHAGGHVYMASTGDGRVLRFDKTGKCPVEAIAQGRDGPDFAVVAGDYVAWIDKMAEPATIARRRVMP